MSTFFKKIPIVYLVLSLLICTPSMANTNNASTEKKSMATENKYKKVRLF